MSIKQIVRGWNLPEDVRGLGRLVFLALADHADAQGRCWPSVGQLARKCACSERTVRRQLAQLQRRGLLAVERRHKAHGGTDTSVYRLFPGPPEGGTSCHPEERTSCHPGDDKHDPLYIEEPSREPSNNSPQPPQGGEAVLAVLSSKTPLPWERVAAKRPGEGFAEELSKSELQGRNPSPGPEGPTSPKGEGLTADRCGAPAEMIAAEQAVAAAYATVTGQPWPRKWRRAVRREVAAGAGGLLRQVTAADLRGAMALAEKRERTFGFGWLMKFLEDQAVRQKARRDAEDRERQKRAADAAEKERRNAEQAARQAYWATLDPRRQQDYLRRAEQERGPYARYGPPLDWSARALAWSERELQPGETEP